MSENTERLDAIQARVDAATPGPWRWDENYGDGNDTGLALTNDAGAEIVGAYNHHCCSFRDDPSVEDSDAEFIANAPADVAFLLDLARKQAAALEAVTDVADRFERYAVNVRNNNPLLLPNWEGRAEGYEIAAKHLREALEPKP